MSSRTREALRRLTSASVGAIARVADALNARIKEVASEIAALREQGGELRREVAILAARSEDSAKGADLLPVLERFLARAEESSVTRHAARDTVIEELRARVSELEGAASRLRQTTAELSAVRSARVPDIGEIVDAVVLALPDQTELVRASAASVVSESVEPLASRLTKLDRLVEALPTTSELVARVAGLVPTPKDGLPGKDATPVSAEELSRAVAAEVAVHPHMQSQHMGSLVRDFTDARFASWELSFERRAQDVLQRAIDRMPVPRDGRDALQLQTFKAVLSENGRTLRMSLGDGASTVSAEVPFVSLEWCGFFKDGRTYEAGNMLQSGGSTFLALRKTNVRPADSKEDWALMVKCGRDGKGEKGDKGRDADPPTRAQIMEAVRAATNPFDPLNQVR